MIILAVDLGDARTGLALCDKGEMLAFPAGVIQEKRREVILEKVAEAAKEHKAEQIILGYPKNRDNTLGERAKISEEFAAALGQQVNIPVVLWDERGTTLAAHAALNMGTTRGRKKKKVVDAVAATILLESYLACRRAAPKEE